MKKKKLLCALAAIFLVPALANASCDNSSPSVSTPTTQPSVDNTSKPEPGSSTPVESIPVESTPTTEVVPPTTSDGSTTTDPVVPENPDESFENNDDYEVGTILTEDELKESNILESKLFTQKFNCMITTISANDDFYFLIREGSEVIGYQYGEFDKDGIPYDIRFLYYKDGITTFFEDEKFNSWPGDIEEAFPSDLTLKSFFDGMWLGEIVKAEKLDTMKWKVNDMVFVEEGIVSCEFPNFYTMSLTKKVQDIENVKNFISSHQDIYDSLKEERNKYIAEERENATIIYQKQDNALSIYKYEHKSGNEVIIPSTYNGLPVTDIESNAINLVNWFSDLRFSLKFEKDSNIHTIKENAIIMNLANELVELPSSLKVIENRAFNSNKIASPFIVDSVERIGNGSLPTTVLIEKTPTVTFEGGSSIQRYKYAECVFDSSYVFYIEDDKATVLSYYGSDATLVTQTEVRVNGSTYPVKAIAKYAFSYLDQLENLTISEGVETCGTVLYVLEKLRELSIPSTLTNITPYLAYGVTALFTINVASGNAKYDSRDNCNGIMETATNKLILGCKNTSIPSTTLIIGTGAFNGNVKRGTIRIPEGVTTIEDSAFRHCDDSLIFLPSTIASIGKDAFLVQGMRQDARKISIVANCSLKDFTIDYRSGHYEVYVFDESSKPYISGMVSVNCYVYSEAGGEGTWKYEPAGYPSIWKPENSEQN